MEEVDGDFIGGVFRIKGILSEREIMFWNTLYPLPAGVLRAAIRLLLHVFPIGGGVL